MLTKSVLLMAACGLLVSALLTAAQAAQEGNFSTGKPKEKQFAVELDEELSTPVDADLSQAKLENPNLGKVVILTEDTYAEHLARGKHFVKFYNPWCVYCHRLAPTWDDLAKELVHEPSVSISKIDCTQFRSVCQKFEVKAYPTLLWIEDGKKIDNYVESRALHVLVAYVKQFLGHDEL